MSLWALNAILQHEILGQTARFERYVADLVYVIATGAKVDTDRAERFAKQVDKVYANPFAKGQVDKPMTAAEIKQHICDKIDLLLEEYHGSDDTCGEDNAG